MAESKLKYPGEVYQPTWRFLRENFTEAEMRREYSRLREIAQKRLGRMGESEFARSATYERNVGQFPKLSAYTEKGRITRKAEFSRRFAQLARFVESPLSTSRGQKAAQKQQIERLHESGYDFVNKSNYWDFVDFMNEYKSKKLDRVYDSDRVAQAYAAANKARVDPEKLLDEFEYFQQKTNQNALRQWRKDNPDVDTSGMDADDLRKAVEEYKRGKKNAKNRRGSSGR